MFKKISIFFFIAFSLMSINTSPILAQANIWVGPDGVDTKAAINEANLVDTDPREMIAEAIKIFLGFLGMIAVILILWAGFLWMTSAGDEGKIKTSKSILSAALIGLILILMSYGLAAFVLTQINGATTGSYN